jgi:alcohol dehydrogenase, propanol-preferring
MRAMVLHAPGPLVLEDVDEPVPSDDEVLIEVGACGVCRTDLQIADGDLPMRRSPVIPGHQVVGRLAGTGERVGVAWLGGPDGTCPQCVAGRENLCENGEYTGWTRDGGYAERMTARRDMVLPLPGSMGDLAAAPLLCAGIIGYRSLKVSGIQPGGRLGLFGFGSSAHLAIQVARHWGCEIAVFTRTPSEGGLARRLGASWVGGYDERPPRPLEAAVTFAPVGSVVRAALERLDRGGTVAVNAIHLDHIPQLDYDALYWERAIRSVANFTRQDAREFLDLAAQIPIRAEVEEFRLEDANGALAALREGRIRGSAVLRV